VEYNAQTSSMRCGTYSYITISVLNNNPCDTCVSRTRKSHHLHINQVRVNFENLGRTNIFISFIGRGPYRKRVQQLLYCCVCIRCSANVLWSHWLAALDRPMRGIYISSYWDGLRCHDAHTKFYKYWFQHSKVDRRDSQIATAWWYHKLNLIKKNGM
jgi:hypothetical protein